MDDKLVPMLKGKNARKRNRRQQERIDYEKMLDSLCGMDSMTPEERMKIRIQREAYQDLRSPTQKGYDAWFDRSFYSSHSLPMMPKSAQRSSFLR